MKILVIDDNQAHLDAAKEQLGNDHELTLASSFDEAETILNHGDHWYQDGPPNFDVVLTDMMLPASKNGVSKEVEHPEQPYGLVFLLNAIRRGVKMIGLVTDGSHHTSPIHWALDMIGYDCKSDKKNVRILGNTKFWCHWSCLKEPEYEVKDWAKALNELMAAD